MISVRNISGLRKFVFNQRLKLGVFFNTVSGLLTGKISLRHYFFFLKRLLFFLAKLQHNKFVTINGKTRINLYVPGFPSRAFYATCNKFKVFDEKLPCLTALISVTAACTYACQHCYQRMDKGKDVDIEILCSVVRILQNKGVTFFNIEGGEPFLVYERLKRVCESIDNRAEIWINSTGEGMTLDRLKELKKNNVIAIMFPLVSPNASEVNNFMGSERAWDTLVKGIELCQQADIAVTFNMCLNKESFYNGNFEKNLEIAQQYNAAYIQLIHPKPAGAWLESGCDIFTAVDLAAIKKRVNQYNHDPHYASYPAISAQIIEEDCDMFGCTAGGTDRFYINAKGDVQACEFLNISFGNIHDEEFMEIYARMRNCFDDPGTGWLCQLYAKEVHDIVKQNKLTALPLNKELSEKMYKHWNRGDKTALYAKVKKMR